MSTQTTYCIDSANYVDTVNLFKAEPERVSNVEILVINDIIARDIIELIPALESPPNTHSAHFALPINKMFNLTLLSIVNCDFKDSISEHAYCEIALPNLHTLRVEHCQDIVCIDKCTRLVELYLNNTRVDYLPELSHLTNLSLFNSAFLTFSSYVFPNLFNVTIDDTVGAYALLEVPSITHIEIHNQISGLPSMSSIAHKITHMSLYNYSKPINFAAFTKLSYLYIHNYNYDIVITDLQLCRSLTALHVCNCKGQLLLSRLPALSVLFVIDVNSFTCINLDNFPTLIHMKLHNITVPFYIRGESLRDFTIIDAAVNHETAQYITIKASRTNRPIPIIYFPTAKNTYMRPN